MFRLRTCNTSSVPAIQTVYLQSKLCICNPSSVPAIQVMCLQSKLCICKPSYMHLPFKFCICNPSFVPAIQAIYVPAIQAMYLQSNSSYTCNPISVPAALKVQSQLFTCVFPHAWSKTPLLMGHEAPGRLVPIIVTSFSVILNTNIEIKYC